MKVRVFPANSRRIAAPKAKVLRVPLKLWVGVIAVTKVPAFMAPDMMVACLSVMYPSLRPGVSRERRRGNSGGKNSYHAQCFDYGHCRLPLENPDGTFSLAIQS